MGSVLPLGLCSKKYFLVSGSFPVLWSFPNPCCPSHTMEKKIGMGSATRICQNSVIKPQLSKSSSSPPSATLITSLLQLIPGTGGIPSPSPHEFCIPRRKESLPRFQVMDGASPQAPAERGEHQRMFSLWFSLSREILMWWGQRGLGTHHCPCSVCCEQDFGKCCSLFMSWMLN